MQAKKSSPSGAAISSTISPPGATRTQRAPTSSADQMCPSASSPQPSGPNFSWPSVSASVVIGGVGATCAQTRRSLSEPSSLDRERRVAGAGGLADDQRPPVRA